MSKAEVPFYRLNCPLLVSFTPVCQLVLPRNLNFFKTLIDLTASLDMCRQISGSNSKPELHGVHAKLSRARQGWRDC